MPTENEKDNRIESLLSQFAEFLAEFVKDPDLKNSETADQANGLLKMISNNLTELRASNRGLEEIRKSDKFGTDPTFAQRRQVFNEQISGAETSFQIEVVPSLKKLLEALKRDPSRLMLAQRLQQILDRTQPLMAEWSGASPTSLLHSVILVPVSDPGEREAIIRRQLLDIGQACRYTEEKEVERSSEGATSLMRDDVSKQKALFRYQPDIEPQRVEKEIMAFHSEFVLQRRDESDLRTGFFFTLSSPDPESPSIKRLSGEPIQIYGGSDLVNFFAKSGIIATPEDVESKLSGSGMSLGALSLMYHAELYYWVAVSPDQTSLTLLDSEANPLSRDAATPVLHSLGRSFENAGNRYLDLVETRPRLEKHENTGKSIAQQHRKSSSWFDYKVPSDPKFFVGRQKETEAFFDKIDAIKQRAYPSRSIVIEAPSGAGKSSFIFKLQDEAKGREAKPFIYSADSRGCFGDDFLAVVFSDFLDKLDYSRTISDANRGPLRDLLKTQFVSFNSIAMAIDSLNRVLREEGIIAILFLDQFEYLAPYPAVVHQIANFQASLNARQSNLVIGFGLRADMNLPRFSEFPFDAWSLIQKHSWRLQLGPLEKDAEQQLIKEVEKAIRVNFEPDFVTDMQQFVAGRPWVLKRVGAHLINEYQGAIDKTAVKIELRLEKFFAEDVRSLKDDELKLLKAIAKVGPASKEEVAEAARGLQPLHVDGLINSLVEQRLLSKIGDKYDTYHDRFKEYILQTLLDPDEKLRFEIETSLRAAKSTMMGGFGGIITTIITGPPIIISACANRELCLFATRGLADVMFELQGDVSRFPEADLPFTWFATVHRLYDMLAKEGRGDESLRKSAEESLDILISSLREEIGALSLPDKKKILDRLTLDDLEKHQEFWIEIYGKNEVLEAMVMAHLEQGEVEMAMRTLAEITEPRRFKMEAMIGTHLARSGQTDEASKIADKLATGISAVVDESLLSFKQGASRYLGTTAPRQFLEDYGLEWVWRKSRQNGITKEEIEAAELDLKHRIISEFDTVYAALMTEITLRTMLKGDVEEARRMWESYLAQRDPHSFSLLRKSADIETETDYLVSRTRLLSGQREEALRLVPGLRPLRAAEICLRLEMREEAEEFFEKAKKAEEMEIKAKEEKIKEKGISDEIAYPEFMKDRVDWGTEIASVYLRAGKYHEAEELLKRYGIKQDDSTELYADAAKTLLQFGEIEVARPLVEKIMKYVFGVSSEAEKIRPWLPSLGWPYMAAYYIADMLE